MNGIRMIADEHLGEQGDKFLKAPLGDGEQFFVARIGCTRIGVYRAHDRTI